WTDTRILDYSCSSDTGYCSWIYDATSGDFDGDGIKDLLSLENYVIDQNNGPYYPEVHVLLGHSDGTFAPPLRFALPSTPRFVVTGDFDRDGRLDFAIVTDNSVEVFLNRSSAPTCPADPVVRSVKVCSPSTLTGNALH